MKITPILLSWLFLPVLAGCSNFKQHRTDLSVCHEGAQGDCPQSSYIVLEDGNDKTEDPGLGFIEFQNDGKLFNSAQKDFFISTLRDRLDAGDKSSLLVAFIHGWHHNAADKDGNVQSFKQLLRTIQNDEKLNTVGKQRQVIGLYLGWQGESLTAPLVKHLSYKKRKLAGLGTGQEVEKVISEIDQLLGIDKYNRFVMVGHSFGGGVLYSAVDDKLVREIMSSQGNIRSFYGNLVVLVNPAIEAEKFVPLHEAIDSVGSGFDRYSQLVLASFTSEGDKALSDEFPKGMKVFFNDEIKNSPHKEKMTVPYGLYEQYSGYSLASDQSNSAANTLTKENFNAAAVSWNRFRAGEGPFKIDEMKLVSAHPSLAVGSPVINAVVPKTVISDHNDIWGERFMFFLRALIGMKYSKLNEC